jgi:hypothetical protein
VHIYSQRLGLSLAKIPIPRVSFACDLVVVWGNLSVGTHRCSCPIR